MNDTDPRIIEACAEAKRRDGWTHGPVKDAVAKTHPCLVPYADLPPEQRNKDVLFLGSVRGMAAALGAKVTYPADGEYPKRTIDWSESPARVVSVDGPMLTHLLDLGSGVRATATPVDTEGGPAFKIESTEPLLKSEASVGAREVFTGKGQRGDANGSCG